MGEQDTPRKLGRYEILGELGRGAMGIVYLGQDPNIGRRVAIKTARRDVLEASGLADELMERFLREARAAGALNHPHIVTIYDAGEEGGVAYIAMELLEGKDLQQHLEAKQRYDSSEAVDIGATICEALAHAHAHGIIHRDIKPANIIMLSGGALKVADFGIARVRDSTLTQDGSLIGTPYYMSPEQFTGQKMDGRSDLFSAGVIIYELLTGEKPFPGEGLSTIMHNVVKVTPIPPRELNFAVSACLSSVVMKALSKDPNQRYQTGEAMAAALRESIKDHPDPAVTQVGELPPEEPLPEARVSIADEPTVVTRRASGPTAAGQGPPQAETVPAAPPFGPSETARKRLPVFIKAVATVVVCIAFVYGVNVVGRFYPFSKPPSYGTVGVRLYVAPDMEAYSDAQDGDFAKCKSVAAAVSIEWVNGDGIERSFTQEVSESDMIELPEPLDRLTIRAVHKDYGETKQDLVQPEVPSDTGTVTLLFLDNKVREELGMI